jgi:hypothetical protein
VALAQRDFSWVCSNAGFCRQSVVVVESFPSLACVHWGYALPAATRHWCIQQQRFTVPVALVSTMRPANRGIKGQCERRLWGTSCRSLAEIYCHIYHLVLRSRSIVIFELSVAGPLTGFPVLYSPVCLLARPSFAQA